MPVKDNETPSDVRVQSILLGRSQLTSSLRAAQWPTRKRQAAGFLQTSRCYFRRSASQSIRTPRRMDHCAVHDYITLGEGLNWQTWWVYCGSVKKACQDASDGKSTSFVCTWNDRDRVRNSWLRSVDDFWLGHVGRPWFDPCDLEAELLVSLELGITMREGQRSGRCIGYKAFVGCHVWSIRLFRSSKSIHKNPFHTSKH